jgi:hypothetical protein
MVERRLLFPCREHWPVGEQPLVGLTDRVAAGGDLAGWEGQHGVGFVQRHQSVDGRPSMAAYPPPYQQGSVAGSCWIPAAPNPIGRRPDTSGPVWKQHPSYTAFATTSDGEGRVLAQGRRVCAGAALGRLSLLHAAAFT